MNPNWEVSTEWKFGNHVLTPGTELTVEGIRGRVRFIKHVYTDVSGWVDVATKYGTRSVAADRIKTVHRRKSGS